MPNKSFHDVDLKKMEKLLVSALECGLAGNHLAVQRLARQVLSAPPSCLDRQDFRERVGTLLVESQSARPKAKAGGRSTRTASASSLIDPDSRLPLFAMEAEGANLPTPVFEPSTSRALAEIVEERRQPDRLMKLGVEPVKTVLLTGPPGVGKTLAARHIATQVQLPLLSVELAAVVSSFLGRSGQNLRAALDYARETPCVLLLDEFDALAKRRDDESDVGELKRLVNVILLELERWPTHSLLVAATNHPTLLDRAIQRRFDVIVDIGLPGVKERATIIRHLLDNASLDVGDGLVDVVASATGGASGSGLERMVRHALRQCALSDAPIGEILIDRVLGPIREGDDETRARFAAHASTELGMSQRDIGALLKVTHPTVRRLLNHWEAQKGA